MQFTIIDGRCYVESDDLWLRIVIQPRRSLEGSATRLTLRAEPMPLLELFPESIGDAPPATAWIWDGTIASAKAIVRTALDVLRLHLAPKPTHGADTREWRLKVLAALGERTAAGQAATQVQQA